MTDEEFDKLFELDSTTNQALIDEDIKRSAIRKQQQAKERAERQKAEELRRSQMPDWEKEKEAERAKAILSFVRIMTIAVLVGFFLFLVIMFSPHGFL